MDSGEGWLWIAQGGLYRVDRRTGAFTAATMNPGGGESLVSVRGVSALSGVVWAIGYLFSPPPSSSSFVCNGSCPPPPVGRLTADSNKLWRVDVRTNTAIAATTLPDVPVFVVATGKEVWVGGLTTLVRVDPRTGRVDLTVTRVGVRLGAASFDGKDMWVLDEGQDHGRMTLLRVDATSGRVVAHIAVIGPGSAPSRIVATQRWVWMTTSGRRRVIHVNPATDRVVAEIPLGELVPVGLALAKGKVWVASLVHNSPSGAGRLTTIDPFGDRVLGARDAPEADDLAVSGPALWLHHQGGVDRLPPK